MKAVFISFNQAHYEALIEILDKLTIRGFTFWEQTQGRGSKDGEPHYGTHAWPTLNSAILTIVENEKLDPLMNAIRELDSATRMQGLRAFSWNVETTA